MKQYEELFDACQMALGFMTMFQDEIKKKRKKPPYTASKDGHLYYDYYQCPKCKKKGAKVKEEYYGQKDGC